MVAQGIDRYLERYAEPMVSELREDLQTALHSTYAYVLVIPLFDEALNCLNTVLPAGMSHTLTIGVVNAAVDADPAAILRTQAFLAQFSPQSPGTVIHQSSGNTLLLIDCCTAQRQLPRKQGVGLARKIGGDIALACIADGRVDSPWIHCTDGDVVLPDNYFETPKLAPDVAVAIYPFCHHPPHDDIVRYEISLRYYVTALAQAGSPYAFQTIGSLLKINAAHYAMVRGFPKLQAAEDFYMLNKLAKTGKVIRLNQPEVMLSSRISQRVPFGTGAAMARLSRNEAMHLYHPQIFIALHRWLQLDQWLWDELRAMCSEPSEVHTHLHMWWQQQALSDALLQTLLYLKVDHALAQAFRQCRDFTHFRFFLHVWFDAFRTLKFIHYQRDQYWPSLEIVEAMVQSGEGQPQFPSKCIKYSSAERKQAKWQSSQDFLNILQHLQWKESRLPAAVGPTCWKSTHRSDG